MGPRPLVALAAGGAIGVIALSVVGVMVVRGCGADPGGRAGPVAADPAARAGSEGMAAKGTAELRAAGCTNAVVVDVLRLPGPAVTLRANEPRYMVTCDVPPGSAPPDCTRLATTYFGAVGGKTDANVSVRVWIAGAAKATCSRLFAPSGVDLGPFPPAP